MILVRAGAALTAPVRTAATNGKRAPWKKTRPLAPPP